MHTRQNKKWMVVFLWGILLGILLGMGLGYRLFAQKDDALLGASSLASTPSSSLNSANASNAKRLEGAGQMPPLKAHTDNKNLYRWMDAVLYLMPQKSVRHLLGKTLSLGTLSLARIEDPKAYAQSLLSAWTGHYKGALHPEMGTVYFGDILVDGRIEEAKDRFEYTQNPVRIYAELILPPLEGGVLIHWYDQKNAEALMWRTDTSLQDGKIYWLEAPWEKGSYQVDVYTLKEPMMLISSGTFLIE